MIPSTAIFLVSLSQHAFKGIGCVLPKMAAIPRSLLSVFSAQSEH